MKKVTVTVPGKIHIMGEHAVVYGKPALLTAIDLRMSVTVEEHASEEKITVVSSEPADHVLFAARFLLDQFTVSDHAPITISVDSAIPAGYHLGSSAAVAVGLSGAMMYFFKQLWNPVRINELAYEIEKKQHGTPSGGDNTVVTMGGFIWFRKELEFLKSIWQLPFAPHPSLGHFFLIKTKRPSETTGEMVSCVRKRYDTERKVMEDLLNRNEQQVRRVTVALKEGNEEELLDAIRIGESTLEGMGVVSDRVKPLIRAIEQDGGAAKILGGGGLRDGVGFLLCYHHDPKRIGMLSEPYGYSVQPASLGAEGIRLESR